MLSPATLLNLLTPTGGVRVQTGLSYGPGARQTLDLYLPKDDAGAPLIVFVYGGSWQRGDKKTYKFAASALARRGLMVAVPDYALYPEARFPTFLEDVAAAVAWARANAATSADGPRRLVLMGHSAGAHIAAMLAFDSRWLLRHGLDPRRDISGFVGLAGAYDFLPIVDPVIKVIFQHPEPASTQPISYVEGGEAPVFLGIAPADTVVRPGNSERLAARLRGKGSPVELKSYPRTDHLSLIGSLSPWLGFLAPVTDDVEAFVKALPPAPRR